MKNFQNIARPTLTADGVKEMYIHKRIDDIQPAEIVCSDEIHGGLVDTYHYFDLTELSRSVEERQLEYLMTYENVNVEKIDEFICEFNFENCLRAMSEYSITLLMDLARQNGVEFEAELVGYYSPAYYNYTTDNYEMKITAFDKKYNTPEKLIEYLKNMINDRGGLLEDYEVSMYEFIEEWIDENTAEYTINGKTFGYDKMLEYAKSL